MRTALNGWGRYPIATAEGTALRNAMENRATSPALPRGMGRSYGDASLPAPGQRFLDTLGLDRFIAFDPETGLLEAEAGVTLQAILDTFVPRGWFLPVTPGTQFVTLGGAVASNVHGKNHHHAGSIENFLDWIEVAAPTGMFRCSRSESPELFRATVGGYGLTGLITRVALRLKLVTSPFVRLRSIRCRTLEELFDAFRAHDADCEYSVSWIDTLARGRALGRGILLLGDHAPSSDAAGRRVPRRGRHTLFKVPFSTPSGLLQPPLLRLFNAAYYHIPRPAREALQDYEGYFYPLDKIGNWNRLYGPRGFFQYQFVIPDADNSGTAEAGVEECLRFLAGNGMGSFLAVLKRCGDDTVMLPFCTRGYTLALDIPHRGEETLRRLDRLDELVLRYGGRVYLTKDARMSPDTFRAMYPEWKTWMETVRRYNPDGSGRSLLSERLGLWNP